jgi:hypothetical protein
MIASSEWTDGSARGLRCLGPAVPAPTLAQAMCSQRRWSNRRRAQAEPVPRPGPIASVDRRRTYSGALPPGRHTHSTIARIAHPRRRRCELLHSCSFEFVPAGRPLPLRVNRDARKSFCDPGPFSSLPARIVSTMSGARRAPWQEPSDGDTGDALRRLAITIPSNVVMSCQRIEQSDQRHALGPIRQRCRRRRQLPPIGCWPFVPRRSRMARSIGASGEGMPLCGVGTPIRSASCPHGTKCPPSSRARRPPRSPSTGAGVVTFLMR